MPGGGWSEAKNRRAAESGDPDDARDRPGEPRSGRPGRIAGDARGDTWRGPMRLLLLIFASDLLAIVLLSQLARVIAGG